MKSTETKISKIVIEVAGQRIDLTIEQAHELQSILNKTFPDKKPTVIEKVIERDHWWPRPYFGPVYSGTDAATPQPSWKRWEVWCGLNQGLGAMTLAAT